MGLTPIQLDFVQNHKKLKRRKMKNRRDKNPAGLFVQPVDACQAQNQKPNAEREGAEKINDAGESHKRRHQTDGQ